jgi:hypothetical protein
MTRRDPMDAAAIQERVAAGVRAALASFGPTKADHAADDAETGFRDLSALDDLRMTDAATIAVYGDAGDRFNGRFRLFSPIDGAPMVAIASNGGGWDHVSISRQNRCPNWIELEFARRTFFRPEITVMQLHVPALDHINRHPYCLHLWHPHPRVATIPRPPQWMV